MSLGNPQSFNRYAYVMGNPIGFIDPSGLNAAVPGQACSFSGKKDSDGNLIYDGTVGSNGNCQSHAGSPVVISGGWGGGWIFGGGGNPSTTINPREPGGGGSIITPIESPVDKIINRQESAKEEFIRNCIKSRVRDRVLGLNRERAVELDKSILGSMAPSPYPAPFGVLSPYSWAIQPGQENNKDALGAAAMFGIFEAPPASIFNAGANVLGAGVYEGTYGFFNFRQRLNEAEKITQEDKNECEGQATNLP